MREPVLSSGAEKELVHYSIALWPEKLRHKVHGFSFGNKKRFRTFTQSRKITIRQGIASIFLITSNIIFENTSWHLLTTGEKSDIYNSVNIYG